MNGTAVTAGKLTLGAPKKTIKKMLESYKKFGMKKTMFSEEHLQAFERWVLVYNVAIN